MFKNYFKTAIRSLLKNKAFTVLNIFGLSVGIAAAMLLTLYVQNDLSYDQFYKDGDRIYRLYSHSVYNGRDRTSITGQGLLAETIMDEFPEVEITGRTHYVGSKLLQIDDKKLYEYSLRYADTGLMDILEIEFIEGTKATALEAPNSIVLTETLAAKLFDNSEEAFGQIFLVGEDLMQVTGIVKDLPKNSHYSANGFISMINQGTFTWNRIGTVTYVKLHSPGQIENISENLAKVVIGRMGEEVPEEYILEFFLYPVKDIYLSEDPSQEGAGNKKSVVAFSIIAFFLILIASINYTNLATARSMKRIKEIGMRKVLGAKKTQLIAQFLIESLMISFISVLIGGFIAEMSSGLFNELTGKNLEIGLLSNQLVIFYLFGFAVLIGLLAGLYPSFYLSSFKPTDAFRAIGSGGRGGRNFRRVLVSIQFIISIGLAISTLIVYKQLNYMENKDLGYNQDHVLSIRLKAADDQSILKQQLLQIPGITKVAATNLIPAGGDSGSTFDITNESGENSRDVISMASIDYDYLETMEMTLIDGRNFSQEFETDVKAIIVNENLVKKYSWTNPIGQVIEMNNEEGLQRFTIIGVVKDFNMLSLYEPIKPFALFLKPQFDQGAQYLFAKINPEQLDQTMDNIISTYTGFEKDYPLNAMFINDRFERIYSAESKRGQIYLSFSVITIAIACVGLFGLAAFILQQKLKEISIRKVLGANFNDIIGLVSKEFVLIILFATIVASPLAYYFMQSWLDSFEYQTTIGIDSFVLAGLASLLIAVLTISVQSLRTARANPADILKCD